MNWFKKRRIKKNWKNLEISPEDIFVDSQNISEVGAERAEGRIDKPLSKYSFVGVLIFLIIISVSVFGRLFILQVVRGEELTEISQDNHLRQEPIIASRGSINDRKGRRIAWSEYSGEEIRRVYSDKSGLSNLIGYTSPPKKDDKGLYYQEEFIGLSGVEEAFNDELKGENGVRLIEEDALLKELSHVVQEEPVNGQVVQLTVDSEIQEALYNSIKSLADRAGFEGGAGVLMNIHNGEIIALTSFPEYENQILADGDDNKEISKELSRPNNPFLNRVISGLFTPGSTVKPYIAIAALEEGIISPEKEIESTGRLVVPNPYDPTKPTIFRDWRAHGWLDLRDAIAWSSNVYFYTIGGGFEDQKGLGIDRIKEYTSLFGLDEKTGIDLPGESVGTIPDRDWKEEVFGESWVLGDTYNTSIGQFGFQVTPISLVRAISAIATDGKLIRPKINSETKTKIDNIKGLERRSFDIVKDGLRRGVLYGTAKALNVSYEDFAAKTGTAELGPDNSKVHSWVSGYFPYDNPKYSFVILMERASRENIFGAPLAARELFDWMHENTPEYFSVDN